jgi:DNA-binding FadR family transcriptional regulator
VTAPAATGKAGRLTISPAPRVDGKRSAHVAARIVDDVTAMGWPVGAVVGSEAQLLERYDVSRAVFREAVRLVEHQQVARMRRGPGGGLVVTEPTADAVAEAFVVYLRRVRAGYDEVSAARMVLEDISCALASSRVGAHDAAPLQDATTDGVAFHRTVAGLSRNPAVELFVDVVGGAARLYSRDGSRAATAQTVRAHALIADAIVGGAVHLAQSRMRRHLRTEADDVRCRRATRQLLPDDAVLTEVGDDKRAQAVARDIVQVIDAKHLGPGELLGSERALMERAGVSRGVLREAVRLLEHHHVVRMRRGPGGGLFVVEPSAAAIVDSAAIYLAWRGARRADLAELRVGVAAARHERNRVLDVVSLVLARLSAAPPAAT